MTKAQLVNAIARLMGRDANRPHLGKKSPAELPPP